MKRLVLIGLVSTLVFLCVFAPAQLSGSLLNYYTDGRLSLAASHGSLWRGNASILLNETLNNQEMADNRINLGRLSWDIQVLQLLTGQLSINLSWNDGTPFWLTIDRTRMHLQHAVFKLNPEIIATLMPALKAAQLGGTLKVNCDNFTLTKKAILGKLEIDWRQASSSLSRINPLGHYQVRLNGQGDQLAIKLNTQNGSALMMQGAGSWGSNKGLQFDGVAEASDSTKVELQELLRVMGNETTVGSGRYQLRL